jgi:hypothetical protein
MKILAISGYGADMGLNPLNSIESAFLPHLQPGIIDETLLTRYVAVNILFGRLQARGR